MGTKTPTHRPLGRLAALAVLAVAAAAAAPPAQAYDPFRIPREQLRSAVRVIALEPVHVPGSIPDAGAAAQQIETMIRESLESGGYKVVAPAEVARIWRPLAVRLGGIYDPVTGLADDDKLKACRELAGTELARLHGADSVLRAGVHYDRVEVGQRGFSNSTWAVDEAVTWQGRQIASTDMHWLPQRVIGTWIGITLRDLGQSELYNIRVAIEWTRVYARRSYEDRKFVELSRPDRIRRAITEALAPLRNAPQKPSAPAPAS